MLLNCPECALQVSDKAVSCPHCGYPMVKQTSKRLPKTNRRRRLPNGFGQISEIKNRGLRKPFRAMVTTGKTATGKPICKLLKPEAYFATYNEAYMALVEYNRSPYDVSTDITLAELYDRWSTEHYSSGIVLSTIRGLRSMWAHLAPLHNFKVKDIRARHVRTCIEDGDAPSASKPKTKQLINMLMDYAVEYEITDHNYARDVSLSKEITKTNAKNKKSHITFTEEEMETLWNNAYNPEYPKTPMILIQCYSGWRPVELCNLKKRDIDLVNLSMTGGCKTDAGTNRTIPIHPRILPLIEYAMANSSGEQLFGKVNYERYRYHFRQTMAKLGLDSKHNPHDCRVYFITEAKRHGVDEYAIKRIVGHAISDITESVYTKRDLEWLREEMEKLR